MKKRWAGSCRKKPLPCGENMERLCLACMVDTGAIAREIASVIETVHNFCEFYKALMLQGLWNRDFGRILR